MIFPTLNVDAIAKAVTPASFEFDRFEPKQAEAARLTFIHADLAQTLNCWVETRAKPGTGTWIRRVGTEFDAIDPAVPSREDVVTVEGAGEARVMGTASGAGITCTYSRKLVFRGVLR